MGEMLVLNPTGELRVMMAKSFSKVYELKLGCLTKETGSILSNYKRHFQDSSHNKRLTRRGVIL
jgi:hypothetical protein